MEVKATLNKPYTEPQRLDFIVVYNHQFGYEIRETITALEAWAMTDAEKAAIREEDFKKEFFEIEGYNFYRKQPKGYTSALESLTVAYNMITSGVIQELPAGTFIFYPEPDYTKPEQCTEEWLVANQILSEAMTKEQFIQFYAAFVVAWNTEMH